MYLDFVCANEHAMYVVRDEYLAKELRRLHVKYRTDRYYPSACYQFGATIPVGAQYSMVFRIQLHRDNPLYDQVLEYARKLAENLPGVLDLQTED